MLRRVSVNRLWISLWITFVTLCFSYSISAVLRRVSVNRLWISLWITFCDVFEPISCDVCYTRGVNGTERHNVLWSKRNRTSQGPISGPGRISGLRVRAQLVVAQYRAPTRRQRPKSECITSQAPAPSYTVNNCYVCLCRTVR